jgi:hypothetical protein
MSKKAKYSISAVLLVLALIYLSTKIVTVHEFSEEVFVTLPGCRLSEKAAEIGRIYTAQEFEESNQRAELCHRSKVEYLKSEKRSIGVTKKYVFDL